MGFTPFNPSYGLSEHLEIVGWVERSETHRGLPRSRWVSLRSTHRTAYPNNPENWASDVAPLIVSNAVWSDMSQGDQRPSNLRAKNARISSRAAIVGWPA